MTTPQDTTGAPPTPQTGATGASSAEPVTAAHAGPAAVPPAGVGQGPGPAPPPGYAPPGTPGAPAAHGYAAPPVPAGSSIADLFERSVKECLMKNFIIIVVSMLFFRELESCVKTIPPSGIGDFLLLISIILVTACFANFAFSYEHSIMELLGMRLLSHVSTFIFMLLIALLLEAMVIGIALNYQGILVPVIVFCLLLYVGCALYDFWDLFRSFKGTVERAPMRPSGLL